MNHLKTALLTLFISFGTTLIAQELLSSVPKKAEEYKATEPNAIATINWLESTPVNEQAEKRKEQSAYFIAWVSGSPTVTISLNAYILDYTKKNNDLLVVFMGGWTKYVLENEYSKDEFQGNLAGIRSMIKLYKTGSLKKDKKMQELVDLDAEGKLEDWLKQNLK